MSSLAERPAPGVAPAGTGSGRRRRRAWHYELLACGFSGHDLVGRGVRTVREDDALVVREESDGLRWHRCLRCDAWLPLAVPEHPDAERVPSRDEITLPLRGRPLRDRFVLRLIAVDRVVHFLVLGLAAAAVFVFTADRDAWRGPFLTLLDVVEGQYGLITRGEGLLGDARRAFEEPTSTLVLLGLAVAAYAVLEGVEAVGLWWGKRWAEYLTFIATTILLAPEVYELLEGASPLKVVALVINIAVVIYLLLAKRLFGLRGGGRAEAAEYERDSGWAAIERTAPPVRG